VSGADKPRLVNCPHCGKPVPWSTGNPHRPFCSERCRTLDLGAWAAERYRIPTVVAPDADDADERSPG
jgi:endogenous inhibitor of DNA gyrase (YacG/DUF329 family)